MHRTTTWLLVLAALFSSVSGFSLYDLKTSYAKFQRWPANGGNRSIVSFRFKTYAKTGLLFYVDDGNENQYLTFYLRDGFLVLDFSDGIENFKTSSETTVDDLQWHKTTVELNSRHAVYLLDDLTVTKYNTTVFRLKSNVFVGGLPSSMDISSLAHIEVGFMQRFMGCVENVRYGNGSMQEGSATILDSAGLSEKCLDACKPRNPCRNRGVCINKFAMAECVCTGTGYKGKTCQEESPVVGIPTPYDRVIIDVPSDTLSKPKTTSLLIRFRSTEPDGVFFYTAHKGDYIVLELTNGNVAASVNLGSGAVTIATKNNRYNDNQWHIVKLNRLQRTVNLTVDDSLTAEGRTQGNFTWFSLSAPKASLIIGGLSDALLKLRSVSRRNFTGCLQELIFNDYELFSKLNGTTSDVRSRGTIIPTCSVFGFSTTPTIKQTTPLGVLTTTKQVNVSPSSSITNLKNDSVGERSRNGSLLCAFNVSCKPSVGFKSDSVSTPHVTSSNPGTTKSTFPPDPSCSSSSPTTPAPVTNSKTTSSEDSRSTFAVSTSADDEMRSPKNPENTESVTEAPVNSMDDEEFTNPPPNIPTRKIIMATTNERKEKDLTLWFFVAAGVGIMAFLLAIAIIVKVNTANRKKYRVKESKAILYDTGSFQKSSREPVHLL